jgi:hypothetical protein
VQKLVPVQDSIEEILENDPLVILLDFFNFDIVLANVNIIKNECFHLRRTKIKFVWLNKTTDKNSVDNIFFPSVFSRSLFFITHQKERGERRVTFKNICEKGKLFCKNGRFYSINSGRIKNI